MNRKNELGRYLRARRAVVQPEDHGLPASPSRRVRGLRRGEVALLAGISPDYYLRLEQGRDQHPSGRVVDGLARALVLDEYAAGYLRRLAMAVRYHPPQRQDEAVPAGIRQLVLSRADIPALVHDRHLDVLLANPLAAALLPSCVRGANLVRAAFLDPRVRERYGEDWDRTATELVATLRALADPRSDDPVLTVLVERLSARSPEFRCRWARYDTQPPNCGVARITHPDIGRLTLHYQKLALTGACGQMLVLYHADPGSHAAEALGLLAKSIVEIGT